MGASSTKETEETCVACDEGTCRRTAPLDLPKCPVCKDPMRSLILLCHGGHSVCGACADALTSCPTCGQPMSSARNWQLENMVSKATGTPAPNPEGMTAPATKGAPTPTPEVTPTPAVEGVPAPATEVAPTPTPEGATVPASEGVPTPAAEGVPAPATEGAPSPTPEGATVPASEGVPTPAAEGVPAPATEGAPSPTPEGATVPASEGVTAPAAEEAPTPAPVRATARVPKTAPKRTPAPALVRESACPPVKARAPATSGGPLRDKNGKRWTGWAKTVPDALPINDGRLDQAREVAEVKCKVKFENKKEDWYRSPIFFVRGLRWQVGVQRRDTSIDIHVTCKGVCDCEASKWPFRAVGEIRVLRHEPGVDSLHREFDEVYSRRMVMVPYTVDVLDPAAGYLHNDQLTIEVCLKTSPLQSASSGLKNEELTRPKFLAGVTGVRL